MSPSSSRLPRRSCPPVATAASGSSQSVVGGEPSAGFWTDTAAYQGLQEEVQQCRLAKFNHKWLKQCCNVIAHPVIWLS
ncbi:unnamed protein product [Victoria cruziana]